MKFTSKLTVIAGASAALALSGCVYVQASSSDRADEERVQAAPPIIAEAPALDTATGPGDRMPSGRDLGVRSAVVAPNAAAATAHPLATQTALDTMKAGDNAVDAAIAANAMLGLVEPTGNGIGGDLFAIVWDPKTQQLYGYNGSGRSAMGATLEDMQAKADEFMDGEEIPPYGAASVTVPGTVDGWYALHERFGKRLMNENLEPAIRYAREGAPIPEVIAFYWSYGPKRYAPAYESGMLEEYDNAKETYFSPTPVEGSLFRNPDLADTLERIAYKGRDEFYTGETAHIMADYFERIGGYLTYEDFANHEGEWVEPSEVLLPGNLVPENDENNAHVLVHASMHRKSSDLLVPNWEAKHWGLWAWARSAVWWRGWVLILGWMLWVLIRRYLSKPRGACLAMCSEWKTYNSSNLF